VTVALGQRGSTIPDGVLVQEAAAGSGESYGALYDRYAPQVFNYCLRISGSPDDAADATHEAFLNVLRRLQDDDRPVLDFAPYLFASARNESYALMRRGNRVYPSESLPEEHGGTTNVDADPERFALLRDSQDSVRAANAQLAPRHREVLALRELGERSYDEIGQIMGISENGAAQLIWRARMKLREALTHGAVASVVAMSPDCERAQVLLTRIQDGEPVDDPERSWLDEHIDECGSCRAARGMLLEVGATYGCWLPVAALIGMREETLISAGNLVGADWSAVASAPPGGGSAAAGSTSGGSGAGAAAAGVATIAAVGIALSVVIHDDSQMKQRLADSLRQPAAEAQAAKAPKAKREPSATPAARSSGSRAAPGAGDAFTALRRPASRTGPVAGAPPSDPPADRRDSDPREPKPNSPRDESTPPPDPKGGPPVGAPSPPEPAQPAPDKPTPPVDTTPPPGPPPPQEQGECTWPGGGGGPGGCPPGHGGLPPGHGGTPPGQAGKPHGRGPR
jgi:RNA polymerase sigma factor (sigma-70 family)